jgi:hypothetical protein
MLLPLPLDVLRLIYSHDPKYQHVFNLCLLQRTAAAAITELPILDMDMLSARLTPQPYMHCTQGKAAATAAAAMAGKIAAAAAARVKVMGVDIATVPPSAMANCPRLPIAVSTSPLWRGLGGIPSAVIFERRMHELTWVRVMLGVVCVLRASAEGVKKQGGLSTE